MLIDCETCTVRGAACSDCVVSVFLDLPVEPGDRAEAVELAADEQRALGVLASRGLIPPLRLQTPRAG